MTPRLFDLHSTWHLPAPAEQVWEVLTDLDLRPGEPVWWPGCTVAAPLIRNAPVHAPAEESLKGITAFLRFRAVLGYSLAVSIHPTQVVPPRELGFEAWGDLEGNGSIMLSPGRQDGTTRMEIRWTVRPTVPWMNLLAPVAAPLFVAAHARTMRQGERGLVSTLTER